jgi:hypothetical protein
MSFASRGHAPRSNKIPIPWKFSGLPSRSSRRKCGEVKRSASPEATARQSSFSATLSVRVHFDETLKNAGTATIDGRIGEDIAVEVESRVSKQVRGALVDLAFHPYRKKLMVLIRAHTNRFTGPQYRVILRRLCCPDSRFEVVEIEGSGVLQKEHFRSDIEKIRTAGVLRQHHPRYQTVL